MSYRGKARVPMGGISDAMRRTENLQSLTTRDLRLLNTDGSYPAQNSMFYTGDTTGHVGFSAASLTGDGSLTLPGTLTTTGDITITSPPPTSAGGNAVLSYNAGSGSVELQTGGGSGVAAVGAGTNISVSGTPTNPVVNVDVSSTLNMGTQKLAFASPGGAPTAYSIEGNYNIDSGTLPYPVLRFNSQKAGGSQNKSLTLHMNDGIAIWSSQWEGNIPQNITTNQNIYTIQGQGGNNTTQINTAIVNVAHPSGGANVAACDISGTVLVRDTLTVSKGITGATIPGTMRDLLFGIDYRLLVRNLAWCNIWYQNVVGGDFFCMTLPPTTQYSGSGLLSETPIGTIVPPASFNPIAGYFVLGPYSRISFTKNSNSAGYTLTNNTDKPIRASFPVTGALPPPTPTPTAFTPNFAAGSTDTYLLICSQNMAPQSGP